jgi:hypothetical protein
LAMDSAEQIKSNKSRGQKNEKEFWRIKQHWRLSY